MIRSYNIQVEENNINSIHFDSSATCYEITLEEYKHVSDRANKFDNKVYIMITFCSIFFAFIFGLLEDILTLKNPDNIKSSVLLCCIIIVYLIICICFICSLVLLILCLKPLKMKRFNPSVLIGKSLWNKPSKVSYMVATKFYCEFISENNAKLQKGYDTLSLISCVMAVVVILSFVLKIVLYLII